MTARWQPLRHPNDLLDHALFIVEIKPKAFTHLAPFYGIAKLPDSFLAFGEFGEGVEAELFSADGDPLGYTIAEVSRWMPFRSEGVRMRGIDEIRAGYPELPYANESYQRIVTDVRFLLAEIDRQAEALKKSRERCWSLCPAGEFHGRVLEHAAECNSCGITRAEYERILYPDHEVPTAKAAQR